ETIRNFYVDILDKKGESFLRVCQVIGPSGSGKTCTLRFFGDNFSKDGEKKGINLDHIYFNLKLEGGRKVVLYRNLLNKVEPALVSASFSAAEMLRCLVHYLQKKRRHIILTIDEIDYSVKHFKNEGIVYDLTRLNELTPQSPCGIVGVTFLARNKKFHDFLERAELSTLGRNYIEFESYSSIEILDILEKRAREALNFGAYSYEVLEFIADVTSRPPINGDLRYALDLLIFSGNLAEIQGSSLILPEHVRMVHSKTYHNITTEDILSLSNKGKLILVGIVRALKRKRSPYASLNEIRSMVGVVCEEFEFKPIKNIEENIQDLIDRNIVDLKSLIQIGISGVTLENLDDYLNNLLEKIRRI
ncbi:MAG: AAA family ATPase, partial [Candidatus Bathyarchaeota archaeon]